MDTLPSHLKVFGRVRFEDELLLVKAKPVHSTPIPCQLWYVQIPHLSHGSIRAFCEHHAAHATALAKKGGVGVVVYDMSDVAVIDSWMSVCLPFVTTMQTLNDEGTLDRWLARAIILVTNETVQSTLHLVLSQMYTPTRPVQIVTSKKELVQALSSLWSGPQAPGNASQS